MKIFLTGATGLIGAHTALALLEAGHTLRLLVRNKQLAKNYFFKHGYQLADDTFIEADMRDAATLRTAMQGCDAVLHAAAMVSLDPKKAEEIYRSNIDSIDAVIGTAHQLSIQNIVYVSSLGAFFIPDGGPINENSPLGISKEAYSKSKRDCEAYVRELQQKGYPIQITYPSGTFSPDDPKLNESNHALTALLKVVPQTTSGTQCIDARDLAQVHVKLLENPPNDFSNARYIVAGHFYSWREFHELLEKVTGRKIFAPPAPGAMLRFFGFLGDIIKKIYPMDFPMTSESMAIVSQWPVADSSKVLATCQMNFRPGEETFKDTIGWMAKAGHLDKRLAGVLH
ncbi:MAG: NAD-dependent epimerase/dehydratase family protein [Pseudomonadales bacterium]|nr:NAD-dependent epimerase/dehydratase family protein [Pseudomonadales bacterium]